MMTRFRDLPREPLPEPQQCTTIGKGKNERPLTYSSPYNRRTRRANGQRPGTTRAPGVGIPHEYQPWHTEDAHG